MKDKFVLLIRVRYGECDVQSVVFNARYGDYIDLASTEFMRALFGSYQAMVDSGYDQQVVSMTIDWQGPARFDDVLSLSVETISIGNTSYTLRVDITEYYTGREIAVSDVTYVMVEAEHFIKTPIPEEIRNKLQMGAPGILFNQAAISLKPSE